MVAQVRTYLFKSLFFIFQKTTGWGDLVGVLLDLLDKVKCQSPHGMPNVDILLRDQFVEHVLVME